MVLYNKNKAEGINIKIINSTLILKSNINLEYIGRARKATIIERITKSKIAGTKFVSHVSKN